MRYFYVILLAMLVSGCTKKTTIEFTGTAPGVNNGKFEVKEIDAGTTVCQADINSGKFNLKQDWPQPGYYYIAATQPGLGTQTYDVYLEPGTYNITFGTKRFNKYPVIETASKIQNDLTAYYRLLDAVIDTLNKKDDAVYHQLNDAKAKAQSPAIIADLTAQLKNADQALSKAGVSALAIYADKYPDNAVALRIMLNLDYRDDPATYYKVFQKFSPAIKSSIQGKYIGQYLDSLAKLPAAVKN